MAEDTTSLVLLIVTFILSVFFIAFVTAMLYDQVRGRGACASADARTHACAARQCEAIWENSTYVENLQSYKGEEVRAMDGVRRQRAAERAWRRTSPLPHPSALARALTRGAPLHTRPPLPLLSAQRTFYEGLCEVFGERFSWRWFVPSIPAPLQRVNIVKEALAAAPSPLLPPMDEVDRLYDSSIANVISAHVDDDAAGDPREPAARESPTPARDVDDSALLAREAAATVGAAAR